MFLLFDEERSRIILCLFFVVVEGKIMSTVRIGFGFMYFLEISGDWDEYNLILTIVTIFHFIIIFNKMA